MKFKLKQKLPSFGTAFGFIQDTNPFSRGKVVSDTLSPPPPLSLSTHWGAEQKSPTLALTHHRSTATSLKSLSSTYPSSKANHECRIFGHLHPGSSFVVSLLKIPERKKKIWAWWSQMAHKVSDSLWNSYIHYSNTPFLLYEPQNAVIILLKLNCITKVKDFFFPFLIYGRFLDHYNYENSNEAIIDNWWKQFDELCTKKSEYLEEKKAAITVSWDSPQ